MEISNFFGSLLNESSSTPLPNMEIHNFWTPILEDEMKRYIVEYESLMGHMLKYKMKAKEMDVRISMGNIPATVRMKPRSLGQLSKHLRLEDVTRFNTASGEIAKNFETSMLTLLSDIRSTTLQRMDEHLKSINGQFQKNLNDRLAKAAPSTFTDSHPARTQCVEDVRSWKNTTLKQAITMVDDKIQKKLNDRDIELEKMKVKHAESQLKSEDKAIDDVVMDDRERVAQIVHEILNTKEVKRKRIQKNRKRNDRVSRSSRSSHVLQDSQVFHQPRQSRSSSKQSNPLRKQSVSVVKVVNNNKAPPKTSLRVMKNTITCYKCGDQGHTIKNCRSSKFRCFQCQRFGHLAKECRDREYQDTFKTSSKFKDTSTVNRSTKSNDQRKKTTDQKQSSNSKVVRNPAHKSQRSKRRD
jgi:hypothetical protein